MLRSSHPGSTDLADEYQPNYPQNPWSEGSDQQPSNLNVSKKAKEKDWKKLRDLGKLVD